MRIVIPNLTAKTYKGPFAYADGPVPPGYVRESEAIAQGYTQEPEPERVPEEVEAWKLAAVLDSRGKLQAIEAAIAAYTGPEAAIVRARWRRGVEFPRNGDTVNALGAAIGYTPAQIDDLFREAAKIAG